MGCHLSMFFSSMLSKNCARLFLSALLLFAWMPLAFAQEPPFNVTAVGRLPAADPNAIAFNGWLLYPTVRAYSQYTDNFFLSPNDALSIGGLGLAPALTAVWNNGIHTTTLYGNLDQQVYPTDNQINSLGARAGFTQRYEAMRDLIFSFNGDYNHQTLNAGLQNSIQTASAAPGTVVLPNGNITLPNGTTVNPTTGQIVGQSTTPAGSSVPLLVNPSDSFTGTFSVDKIFNRGILSLSASFNHIDFANQSIQPDTSSRTLTERAAFWLGPLIYAYSNGSFSTVVSDAAGPTASTPSFSTNSYRVIAGLGTRSTELFSGSAYFGHQASDGGGSAAEGNVYGGVLSYRPTPDLTFAGTFDRTINIASQISATNNLALTLPGQLPVQIALGDSTVITSYGLKSTYQISRDWFANCQLTYTHIGYLDITRLDNAWVVDTILRYDIWRNMSLTWEYRYTAILSNVALQSAISNYAVAGATYRF